MSEDVDLLAWFEKGGGELNYASMEREDGEVGRPSVLQATETIAANKDVVLKMPLKLTLCQMTQRLVKTKRGRLSEHLNDIFKVGEEREPIEPSTPLFNVLTSRLYSCNTRVHTCTMVYDFLCIF
jgi:hypothetical protein